MLAEADLMLVDGLYDAAVKTYSLALSACEVDEEHLRAKIVAGLAKAESHANGTSNTSAAPPPNRSSAPAGNTYAYEEYDHDSFEDTSESDFDDANQSSPREYMVRQGIPALSTLYRTTPVFTIDGALLRCHLPNIRH
eukprot:SAG31_NODE_2964_length_4844_cov_1.789673_3_plen_138_part_00